MKKIMIAAAVICMAVVSQAATYKWATYATGTNGALYNGTTAATAYATYGAVTCYLIDAATYSQANAFADLVAGSFNASKTIANATLSSASKIGNTNVTYGEAGVDYTTYWVALLDDSHFYISTDKTAAPLGTGAQNIVWNDTKATSQATFAANEGFKGAGVYETIPEPTSALMLLVGLAGLALKRKVA